MANAHNVTPGTLANTLAALPVEVERVSVAFRWMPIRPYPQPGLPRSVVRVHGGGKVGQGEYIGWTREAHRAFAENLEGAVQSGLVGDAVAVTDPAVFAALECAIIDLALRQIDTTLADLTGVDDAAFQYVLSFDACRHPADRLSKLLENNPDARFKVDVHPDWTAAEMFALANTGRVATLDFKGLELPDLALRIREAFPSVRLEDAPLNASGLLGADQEVKLIPDAARAAARGEQVNIKLPRMGGPLVALRGLDGALQAGGTCYFGGMYEVGPGRRQAQALAALFTPEADNDVAPIGFDETDPRGALPLRVDFRAPGFGDPASVANPGLWVG